MSDDIPIPAVICDLDGTACNTDHRQHYVRGEKKDFATFHDECVNDPVHAHIRSLINMLYMNRWHIVICSGRPDSHREVTEAWLKSYGVFYHELMMRPAAEMYTPDTIIKEVMLEEIRKVRPVAMAFDDRDKVVAMWRRNGVPCFQVAEGDF